MKREERDGEVTPGLSSLDIKNTWDNQLFITLINALIIFVGDVTSTTKSTHAHLPLASRFIIHVKSGWN